MDRQTHAAPPHIYLPWLAGLVSAHACTCWLIRRAETPVRQRKTFPLFTPTTLTRTQILNKSSCAGYKVRAGRNSGVHLFMTWYFVYFKSVRVIGLVGLHKLFVESVHYECLPSHFLGVSLPWLLPIVLGACFKMLLAFINHLSLIDWCAKPKINMVSEPSVCSVTNIQENPQEILCRLTPKGMNSQPKEGLFLKKWYLHSDFNNTPQFCISSTLCLLSDKGTLVIVSLVFSPFYWSSPEDVGLPLSNSFLFSDPK